jgi:hypothetical protein
MIGVEGYYDLIGRVAKVDVVAALYMRGVALDAESYSSRYSISFCYSDCLAGAFVWYMAPQGRDYWESISEELYRREHGHI